MANTTTAWGADVEALWRLAKDVNQWAGEFIDAMSRLNGSIEKIYWFGPDADRFRGETNKHQMGAHAALVRALNEAEGILARNASQQETASAAENGGSFATLDTVGKGMSGGPEGLKPVPIDSATHMELFRSLVQSRSHDFPESTKSIEQWMSTLEPNNLTAEEYEKMRRIRALLAVSESARRDGNLLIDKSLTNSQDALETAAGLSLDALAGPGIDAVSGDLSKSLKSQVASQIRSHLAEQLRAGGYEFSGRLIGGAMSIGAESIVGAAFDQPVAAITDQLFGGSGMKEALTSNLDISTLEYIQQITVGSFTRTKNTGLIVNAAMSSLNVTTSDIESRELTQAATNAALLGTDGSVVQDLAKGIATKLSEVVKPLNILIRTVDGVRTVKLTTQQIQTAVAAASGAINAPSNVIAGAGQSLSRN